MDYRYHRLARATPGYEWWRLPLAGFLSLIATVVGSVALIVPFWLSGADFLGDLVENAEVRFSDPATFAYSMLAIIIMIPILFAALAIVRHVPLGLLHSVTGHVRWRWLGRCFAVAFAVTIVVFALSLALGALAFDEPVGTPAWNWPASLVLIVLALALTPFQAAAEEYVFRGYLFQLFGAWFKSPVVPMLLTVPFFTFGHIYDAVGLVDVAVFGLAAVYLTWRTGGLEAAIAVHVSNNVVIFVLGAVNLVDADATGGSWLGVATTIVTMSLYTGVVERAATKRLIAHSRRVEAPHVVT